MNRIITAFLAVALAVPAGAQLGGDTAAERMRRARQPAPPAAAPAPQGQAQAPGQPAPGQVKLSEEQKAALGEVWARNRVAVQIGDLAATRGASKEVQNLGRTLAEDHRREEKELSWLLSHRGVDVNQLAAGSDQQRLEGELAQITGKSGEEFDREFVSFTTRNNVAFVDALKRARDVTPGKDAELKRWLDDSENTEEGHLTAARQLKAQRQARTPPAR